MSEKPPAMRRLKRRGTLSEEVQQEIKNYILRHDLRPGAYLPPETELSRQLGISRNAVREGVKRLESLGILQARPGAGLLVRSFSFEPILDNLAYGLILDMKQFVDLLEVRAFLETGLVEAVVRTIPAPQVEKLHVLLERWARNLERGVVDEELDRRFHLTLIEHMHNTMLSEVLDLFWLMIYRAKEFTAFPGQTDPTVAYQAHVRICQAIEARDAEATRKYLGIHFDNTRTRLRRAQEMLERERAARHEGQPGDVRPKSEGGGRASETAEAHEQAPAALDRPSGGGS